MPQKYAGSRDSPPVTASDINRELERLRSLNAEMLAALEAVMARWRETKASPPLKLLNQVAGAIRKGKT